MKKVLIPLMLIVFGLNIQGYAQKFSGYVEEPHIFNVGNNAGNLYSMGANLSFGVEYNNRMYVGGGISMYYLNCLYYYAGYYDYYWGNRIKLRHGLLCRHQVQDPAYKSNPHRRL